MCTRLSKEIIIKKKIIKLEAHSALSTAWKSYMFSLTINEVLFLSSQSVVFRVTYMTKSLMTPLSQLRYGYAPSGEKALS